MKLTDTDINSLVPHDMPMILLDNAIEADELTMSTTVTIREDSLFCTNGAVGSWIGLEYMAQTIAAHTGYIAKNLKKPLKIGYLLGTRDYHCTLSSFPVGSTLKISVKMEYKMIEEVLGAYQCFIHIEEKEVARAVCTVYQPKNHE